MAIYINGCYWGRFAQESSLRTADFSPRSSPLRNAKRPTAAMSEEKRLSFVGYLEREPFTVQPIKRPQIGAWTTQERRNTHFM